MSQFASLIAQIAPDQPVLIAGPTASGKSALALEIVEQQGGVVVNADASQVYDCWQIITARPAPDEEARAPHLLYGHIAARETYSTGHWLREVAPLITAQARPVIVGGTGLYFKALTEGLVEIPATSGDVRQAGDAMCLADLLAQVDARTKAGIDQKNRARVQRAWEVLQATGRGLADWQAETPAPALPLKACFPIYFDVDKDWLNTRIAQRFDIMLDLGAMDEIACVAPAYDPSLPAHRAIGVPELMAFHHGEIPLDEARERAVIATRQYAKRQRTWMRSKMRQWHGVPLP